MDGWAWGSGGLPHEANIFTTHLISVATVEGSSLLPQTPANCVRHLGKAQVFFCLGDSPKASEKHPRRNEGGVNAL